MGQSCKAEVCETNTATQKPFWLLKDTITRMLEWALEVVKKSTDIYSGGLAGRSL